MMIEAMLLVLSVNIELDLSALLRAQARQPAVTCGIRVVGYRFVGTPGRRFRYAGDRYEIPSEGWIELLADRSDATYLVDDRRIAIDAGTLDPFGFQDVELAGDGSARGHDRSKNVDRGRRASHREMEHRETGRHGEQEE